MLTSAQMQAMDRLAIDEVGIPSLVLMEVAGRAVADAAGQLMQDAATEQGPILALAGSGNNGADAVVAARHLRERLFEVTLLVLGEPDKTSTDLGTQVQIARELGVEARFVSGPGAVADVSALLQTHSVVIDGLFGTGLSRAVEGWRSELIQAIESSARPVVAVDIPSGIDADTGQAWGNSVSADITVTFQFPKFGQLLHPGRTATGELQVVDIGIPPSRLPRVEPFGEIIEDSILELAVPLRDPNSHKGSYGHLLVVAGVPTRPGAALLAGRAALRAGAGLVTVGSDPETIKRLSGVFEELMGLELSMNPDALLEAMERRTALAIGPSLEPSEALKTLLKAVLPELRAPVVLDAGALSALAGDYEWLSERMDPTVLTPHPGEMARLLGVDAAAVQRDRVGVARKVAQMTQSHVVLKGASTVVADPDGQVGLVLRGHPGMATGGSGDVLTGILGSLLAQGVPPALASKSGALMHAWAGDEAAARKGHAAMIASDLIEALPPLIAAVVEGLSDDTSGESL